MRPCGCRPTAEALAQALARATQSTFGIDGQVLLRASVFGPWRWPLDGLDQRLYLADPALDGLGIVGRTHLPDERIETG